jgi:DNA repair photolyase
MFRFTIGSLNPDASKFWEPGAPEPFERICALEHAFLNGYQTSVSMEPMLFGYSEAIRTFHTVERFVTDTIWIGKMNKIRQRVDITDPNNLFMVQEIERMQRDEAILKLDDELKDE